MVGVDSEKKWQVRSRRKKMVSRKTPKPDKRVLSKSRPREFKCKTIQETTLTRDVERSFIGVGVTLHP